jgi:ribosomal protein S18 acetylase RimI-like enzyme
MSLPSISLRQANAADAEALAVFAAAVFPLGGRPGADPADLEAFISTELTPAKFRQFLANPNAALIVASDGPQIAGFILAMRNCGHPQIEAQCAAELRKLYVDPQHHGKGVANALMQQALDWLHPAADVVWLSVFSENPRAIAFYERWGFRQAGTQYFVVGQDHQKDLVMRRDL